MWGSLTDRENPEDREMRPALTDDGNGSLVVAAYDGPLPGSEADIDAQFRVLVNGFSF